jgi:hypothetical protein
MNNQMHDVYETMVMAVGRVGRVVPSIDRALCEAIQHMAQAIPYVEDPDGSECQRVVTHLAHVSVLALAQRLAAERDAGADIGVSYASVVAVLDTLDPHVSRADHLLRCVLLDGEPLDAAARRLWCA